MKDPGFAPAKINLFLRVWPSGPDGYHPLQSWMVFAQVGDHLQLIEGGEGIEVHGPFAAGVPKDSSNLAVRARDAFAQRRPLPPLGLKLEKNLPPASGIGGGSSDAAAVLRLLQERAPLPTAELAAIALSLGADVPACLRANSVIAAGRGERLSSAPKAPALPAVLVNPGIAVSTAEVFRGFDDLAAPDRGAFWPEWMARGEAADVAAAIALVTPPGNDLQRSAERLAPDILDVIRALQGDRRCRLARMSGSGATCFALCLTREDAAGLAADVSRAHPHWWVAATALN